MIRKISLAISIVSIIAMGLGCASSRGNGSTGSTQAKAEPITSSFVYNRFNIHVVDVTEARGRITSKASYANWVAPISGHWIIPVNSKISIKAQRRGFKSGLLITVPSKNREVFFEINTRNTGNTIAEYAKLLTSPTPVSLQGLSAKDMDGVKQGKALVGMTKAGVRIALGHPAKHKTPTLTENRWVYWRDRFRMLVVEFDDDGKVRAVR